MRQLSELQPGLVFHAPLSENYPAIDLVSKTVGTATDTYPVIGRDGSGRRRYENTNTGYVTIADADRFDFGTGDFTLITSVTPDNITDNGKYLISKEASGIGYGLYQEDNDVWIRFDDGTTDVSAIIGTDILTAGTKITLCVVFNRAGNAVLYLNGSTSSSGTVAISTADLTLNNTGAIVVGNIEAHNAGFSGQIHFTRAFNFALTTQITNYSKPSYPIEATHRGSGATKNVLDLNAEGATSAYWYDKTNSLTATVSGATLIVPPASEMKATWFNGTTSNIDIGDNDKYTLTPSFSIHADIFPISISSDASIVSKAGAGNTREYMYILTSNGGLLVYLFNGGGSDNFSSFYTANNLIQINSNYKIEFYYSSSVGVFYINNVKYQASSVNYGTGFSAFANTSSPLLIGKNAVYNYFFSGSMKNIMIYNRILDADQIKLLYDLVN